MTKTVVQGWQCPKCESILSPNEKECPICKPPMKENKQDSGPQLLTE